ncbi:MAG: hypothetical protein OXN17_02055 [Candidatus Poribacteria bacterium]|nr:hypothetical protein [Candidatus Poribacteria bacterium]MDE0503702.1 hypothetical protein [Candidatus Poribacteria bacterium]
MRGISKVVLGLSILGLVLLLAAYGLYSRGLQAQGGEQSQPTVKKTESKLGRTTSAGRPQDTAKTNERTPPQRQINQSSDDYYQPIVENNLFRPLGWRKPDNEAEYVLIGTLIESNNQRAKAFLIERRSDQFYPVSVGEKVGDATVESIKPNEVSLDKYGKKVTLRANSNRFLDTSAVSGEPRPGFNRPSGDESVEKKEAREDKPENRGNQGWNEDRMRNIAERFRNASPEERKRMREEFRRRGRERRARGERGEREGRGRGRARDGARDSGRRRD